MCESGKQCYDGESCGTRVDQLKRLLWVLMIWVFALSLGLVASITFQLILHRVSDTTNPNCTECTVNAGSQLTSYSCFGQNKNDNEAILLWKEKNRDNEQQDTTIKIKDDRNYFLFLKVTLQSPKPGVNYTVKVKKSSDTNDAIIEGHINATEYSTGFLGNGVLLSENTSITVICSPWAAVDVKNTYLGLIKF